MRKKPVVLFFDLLLLLVLGIIFLIVSTGGFSFSLGTFTITAYGLKNPTIGLIMILFFRKILLGKFLGEFLGLIPFRRRFVESPRFRKLVIVFPLFLILMMGVIAAINPLQPGLKASYYDNAVYFFLFLRPLS